VWAESQNKTMTARTVYRVAQNVHEASVLFADIFKTLEIDLRDFFKN